MPATMAGNGLTSERARDRLIALLRSQGIRDENVLSAMRNVPRHRFVDEALAARAYEDSALPIGLGQTISQPYIVALMTQEMLGGRGVKRVLEIGTGCGYQTAVLAKLVPEVYTVERLAPLMVGARKRLTELGVRNVQYRAADGWLGWREFAPYDGILIAAAGRDTPEALLEQLAPGGRMVIPLEDKGGQTLWLYRRLDDQFQRTRLDSVRFVPLVRTGQ